MPNHFVLNRDTACLIASIIGRNPKTHVALGRLAKGMPSPDLSIRHRFLSETSILSEFYSRQALTVLLQGDIDLSSVMAAGWPDIADYVDRHGKKLPLDMNRWFDLYTRSHNDMESMSDDDFNDAGIIIKFVCFKLQIPTTGEIQDEFDEVMQTRCKYARSKSYAVPSDVRPLAKKITRAIKFMLPSQRSSKDFTDRIYEQEGLCRDSLLQGIRVSSRDVEEVAAALATSEEHALRLQDPLFSQLFQTTLQMKWLLRAYSQGKNDFWRCVKLETGLAAAKAKSAEKSLRAIESEAKVRLLESELESLRSVQRRQQSELRKAKEDRQELMQLREFLRDRDVPEEFEDSLEVDLNQLNELQALFVGGHESVREKLSIVLPDWKFYGSEIASEPVRTAPWVFFHPATMSHTVYYRLLSLLPDRRRLRFVSSNNVHILLNKIRTATTQV